MAKDWSYIRRGWARRAAVDCPECGGSGCQFADDELPCWCVAASLVNPCPDPLADEGQSDARELGRRW
jgi:hypothetical protein